jgi:hypothetical protein
LCKREYLNDFKDALAGVPGRVNSIDSANFYHTSFDRNDIESVVRFNQLLDILHAFDPRLSKVETDSCFAAFSNNSGRPREQDHLVLYPRRNEVYQLFGFAQNSMRPGLNEGEVSAAKLVLFSGAPKVIKSNEESQMTPGVLLSVDSEPRVMTNMLSLKK